MPGAGTPCVGGRGRAQGAACRGQGRVGHTGAGGAAAGRGQGAGERRHGGGRSGGGRRRAQGRERGRAGKGRGGRGRERRREGEGSSPRGPNSGDRHLQSLGHHGEREVEEGEEGCCAGNPNERGRGGGGAWEGVGARGAQGRAGPGWVGLGRATSRIETHDTHDPNRDTRHDLNHEPKTETERDDHAISDKEMCFGMMQHP
jgi:hypothetical protein